MCPGRTFENAGSCVALCGNDSDCSGSKKCCTNGCGTECTEPITDDYRTFRKEYENRTSQCFGEPCNLECRLANQTCTSEPCPLVPRCINVPTCPRLRCTVVGCSSVVKDPNGCRTCDCSPRCIKFDCPKPCPNGYTKDDNGCYTCTCLIGNTLCRRHQLAAYKAASVESHQNLTVGVFVPKCQRDGSYDKVQCMDTLGLCWCVDNYGNEISGTRIRGVPLCANVKANSQKSGFCPAPWTTGNNDPCSNNCLTDTDCVGDKKCCFTDCGRKCTFPNTAESKEYVNFVKKTQNLVCPPEKPLVKCNISECSGDVTCRDLSCRIIPCGSCTVGFFDNFGNNVQCYTRIPGCLTLRHSSLTYQDTHFTTYNKSIIEVNNVAYVLSSTKTGNPDSFTLSHYIPQCDQNNFKYTQCLKTDRNCWCSDTNGRILPNDRCPRPSIPAQSGLNYCMKMVYDITGVVLNQGSDRVKVPISTLYRRFIPRCTKINNRYTEEYYPLQCWQGICWCSSRRGRIEQDTITTGYRNCAGATRSIRPGLCPVISNLEMAASNCTIRNSCENDTQCDAGYKCCLNGCGGTLCLKAVYPACQANHLAILCEAPRCALAECPAHPNAICIQDICSNCAIRFHDGNRRSVNCTEGKLDVEASTCINGLKKCQLARYNAKMKAVGLISNTTSTTPSYGIVNTTAVFLPECDKNGEYLKIQCRTIPKECWCVDRNGVEVIGTRSPSTAQCNISKSGYCPEVNKIENEYQCTGECSSDGDCGSDYKCCATEGCGIATKCKKPIPKEALSECFIARRNTTTLPNGRPLQRTGVYIPECNPDGSFAGLQCDESTKYCWCVNIFGEIMPGTVSINKPTCPTLRYYGATLEFDAPFDSLTNVNDFVEAFESVMSARFGIEPYTTLRDVQIFPDSNTGINRISIHFHLMPKPPITYQTMRAIELQAGNLTVQFDDRSIVSTGYFAREAGYGLPGASISAIVAVSVTGSVGVIVIIFVICKVVRKQTKKKPSYISELEDAHYVDSDIDSINGPIKM
ncbi:Equistatin [Trichoplax sp. H2]|nr:Equistatin [Trichoplax sp. H2]|eukprot:RDD42554.1 Equistatin [Trichoplax sp. H2]